MIRAFHDTVTAVSLSAVTSTPCTAAVREWEYTYMHALGERDVITTLYASMCRCETYCSTDHNALILRGLASVDMLAVTISPRPAPVKAVTVKIYAVPNSSLP